MGGHASFVACSSCRTLQLYRSTLLCTTAAVIVSGGSRTGLRHAPHLGPGGWLQRDARTGVFFAAGECVRVVPFLPCLLYTPRPCPEVAGRPAGRVNADHKGSTECAVCILRGAVASAPRLCMYVCE